MDIETKSNLKTSSQAGLINKTNKAIERTLREKLAAAHHIVRFLGYDDLLATHLSARIPNTNYLLITPINTPFEDVCASKLIKCDFNGNIISDNGEGLLPQAINIHGEIYKADKSINSAMHTHSIYGVAVSTLKCGVLFNNQQAMRFYKDIAYHSFDGLALENEGKEIVSSMGSKKSMVLNNHGLLTTWKSIEEAMYLLYYLEAVCEIQIKSMSTGAEFITPSVKSCEKTKAQFEKIKTPELEFEVLTRRISGLYQTDYKS